ncbi:MAG TPA: isochorismatase family protein [Syntrophorhabdaceae bacterium]|nr:isochorismatase family protein [Syntrophorhabdaceae bacterium]
MKIELLIIDPQYDFCDPKGSLYVPGANEDMKRLAEMIKKDITKIDRIHITLDEHNTIHIAHPVFWKDSSGRNPEPFVIISLEDVRSGKWTTARPDMMERAVLYIQELEKKGRYNLCIWPPHCIRASLGATIFPELHEAIKMWEIERFTVANKITKGENFWTEHYSALKAEVPDPDDPRTDIKKAFIEMLKEVDIIVVAGEALSHCVANTIRDMVDYMGCEYASRFVLLRDATSPVKGFENLAEDFVKDMVSKGMRVANTKDFI